MYQDLVFASAGGLLLGIASLVLLFFLGKILGISGILSGLLTKDANWRTALVLGLVSAGALLKIFGAQSLAIQVNRPLYLVALAGFLVGFGARLSNGCTSGHGICGMGRLSARSFVAVICFMFTGALTVWLTRRYLGL